MRTILVIALLAAMIISLSIFCKTDAPAPAATVASYIGSNTCKSCHAQEHSEWLTSHHFMAMQPANDSTVLGDFNNSSYTADGETTRFFKKDGKYFIHAKDDKGIQRDMEVLYTFGVTPLQQYLVAFDGGRMQATRASWDSRKGKWFHQYAGQQLPHNDWLHWTGNGQNWNTMCASCHSTNLRKGYETETDQYKTTWNEINVSCESCHGPGKNHLDYIQGKDYKKGKKIAGSMLMMYAGAGQTAQINACGYCHARRVDITENPHPGAQVADDYIPELPTTPYFYADGQMQDEVYNYTSFLQSKMYARGVQCTHCHNPHSGKLKMDGPTVCSQCHSPATYAHEKHTLHKAGTVGVNCISCHMPAKTYMGNDERHDHSFRIPRPDLSAKYGVPNTCNACHSSKSAAWAAEAIAKGYGRKPNYHWSEDLVPGSLQQAQSTAHLHKLTADSAVPGLVRAAAFRYLSQMQQTNPAVQLLPFLTDSSAMVRYTVLQGLRNYPPQVWLQAAAPLLSDKVRAVRIAAAQLLLDVPSAQLPAQHYEAFTKAKNELYRFVMFQTDFAQGNLSAGDYFNRIQDLNNAEKFYKRAIAKDSQLVNARVNLAATLNSSGRNDEARKQLELSGKIMPGNDHIFYALGLLYAETGETLKATQALRQAIQINSGNIRAAYNLGLLLAQSGDIPAAEKVYTTALKQEPANGDVLYALTILYLQTGQNEKALQTGRILKQNHAGNPAYADVVNRIP